MTETKEEYNLRVFGRAECKHCGELFTKRSYNHGQCDDCKERIRAEHERERLENPPTEYVKVCPVCGDRYSTTRPTKIYCDAKCRELAYSKRQGLYQNDPLYGYKQFVERLQEERQDRQADVERTLENISLEIRTHAKGVRPVTMVYFILAIVDGEHYDDGNERKWDTLVRLGTLVDHEGHDLYDMLFVVENLAYLDDKDFWKRLRAYANDLSAGRKETFRRELRYVYGILRNRFDLDRGNRWEKAHFRDSLLTQMKHCGRSDEELALKALTCETLPEMLDYLSDRLAPFEEYINTL